jgi:hypothetical protein
VARAHGSRAAVRGTTAGIVQVSYPSDWRRTSTRGASSLGMRHEVTLTAKRPDGGQLTIGEETDFNPGTRSTPLLAALRRAPTPQIVKLGSPIFTDIPICGHPAPPRRNSSTHSGRAGLQLRARRIALRLSACQALATAHTHAAAELEAVDADPAGAANQALIDALRAAGMQYQQLARAIRSEDVRGYRRAQSTLDRTMKSLDRVFAQLTNLGYRVS